MHKSILFVAIYVINLQRSDFASNIYIVEEEADESAYWLELLGETKILAAHEVTDLLKEALELTAIFAASGKKAKRK